MGEPQRAMMALFDNGHRLDLPAGYSVRKDSDDRWQILKDGVYLGLSFDTNVPVGRGGSVDAEIKQIADDLNAACTRR